MEFIKYKIKIYKAEAVEAEAPKVIMIRPQLKPCNGSLVISIDKCVLCQFIN